MAFHASKNRNNIFTLLFFVVIGYLVWLFAPSLAQSTNQQTNVSAPRHQLESTAVIPGGSLRAHEGRPSMFGRPSHTIAYHVGKSYNELLDRLNEEKNLQRVSSFNNFEEAEFCVATALQKEQKKIERFMNDSKQKRLVLNVKLGIATGMILERRTKRTLEGRGVRIIIDKVAKNRDLRYTIVSSFPIL